LETVEAFDWTGSNRAAAGLAGCDHHTVLDLLHRTSLGGDLWNDGANVSITEDAVVSFVAIDPSGNASEVVSKSFKG
jgi:hypothetical protein